jgi:hypothetical protein
MGHRDQSGESVPVPRPWTWRGWSRRIGRYINGGERHYYSSVGVLYSCLLHRFRHKFPSSILPNLVQLIRNRSFLLRPLRPSITCKSYKKILRQRERRKQGSEVLDAEFVMFQSFFAGLFLRSQKTFCCTKAYDNLSSIAGEYFDDMQTLKLSSPTSYLDLGELQMLKSTISKYLRHWLQKAVTWKCPSRCS